MHGIAEIGPGVHLPNASELRMTQWVRRIKSAVGIGLTWAAAWGSAGVLIALGFVVLTGERPDPPIPLLMTTFGFVAGMLFSGVLRLLVGHRRFDQLSIPRIAAWGAVGGSVLAAMLAVTVALVEDPAFLSRLVIIVPVFASAAAASAAGSLVLARKATDRSLPSRSEGATRDELTDG
jgi:peptidoglycan/LPS O-acetylase OafA/YrhL